MTPWDEGFDAYNKRLRPEQCPYFQGDMKSLWLAGWEAGAERVRDILRNTSIPLAPENDN